MEHVIGVWVDTKEARAQIQSNPYPQNCEANMVTTSPLCHTLSDDTGCHILSTTNIYIICCHVEDNLNLTHQIMHRNGHLFAKIVVRRRQNKASPYLNVEGNLSHRYKKKLSKSS